LKKLAIHVHIYYKEQLKDILEYLKSLRYTSHDIFVTLVNYDKNVIDILHSFNPNIKIKLVENRGYDVGPFIDFLHSINLEEYEYIIKIHTKCQKKQSYTLLNSKRLDNKLWCKILWDSLLKSRQRVAENLRVLDDNPKVGLLGSSYCYTNSPVDYMHLLPQINNELQSMNLKPLERVPFIAGTMFLVRSNLLKPLKKYTIDDFAITNGKVKDGTLAHVFERLFSAIVIQQGYSIYQLKHDAYALRLIIPTIKRFFYQKKITNSGKLVIKICKIPVYSRKEAIL
jgi:lipopolysaccharide biosynthesis protein